MHKMLCHTLVPMIPLFRTLQKPTYVYMSWYCGPPPPSGTVQSMYSRGILIEQHLQ